MKHKHTKKHIFKRKCIHFNEIPDKINFTISYWSNALAYMQCNSVMATVTYCIFVQELMYVFSSVLFYLFFYLISSNVKGSIRILIVIYYSKKEKNSVFFSGNVNVRCIAQANDGPNKTSSSSAIGDT